MRKDIILVGDKVLIEPDENSGRTDAGLYLPQGVKEKEKVNIGKVVMTGPGYPVPDPSLLNQEPWNRESNKERYFPLQAQNGDYCLFLRDQAIEVDYEHKKYLVVPHGAILLLLREKPSGVI